MDGQRIANEVLWWCEKEWTHAPTHAHVRTHARTHTAYPSSSLFSLHSFYYSGLPNLTHKILHHQSIFMLDIDLD